MTHPAYPEANAEADARKEHEKPFNIAAHEFLTTNGYTYQRNPADFDDGDAENGPGTSGHPAYDEYESESDRVFIVDGGKADWRSRDLDEEAFIDRMQAAAEPPAFFTVAVYLERLAFGGPEEGGWWYTRGELVCNLEYCCLNVAFPQVFAKREEAAAAATKLNEGPLTRLNQGRRPISSVLSEGRYNARVCEYYPEASFPKVKPHYE